MTKKLRRRTKRRSKSGHTEDNVDKQDAHPLKSSNVDDQAPPTTPTTRSKRYIKRLVFLLGTVVGVTSAFFIFSNSDSKLLDNLTWDTVGEFLGSSAIYDDIKTYLSNGLFQDLPPLSEIQQRLGGNDLHVGQTLDSEGYESNFPVVMIPGVISSGLESWSLRNCSLPYFRKRLWGSFTMIKAMLLDKHCWLEHLMLDKETGLDPPGIKLRAAQGFEAADFFITGYWIWSKIIENLAAIGYEPNNMLTASYDWRLSYYNLEVRDNYFSKLKMFIEQSKRSHGKKIVLISHSMGAQVTYYFLKWVETEGYGNGGPNWVEEHIEALINVSGSLLGAPKTLSTLLSGEMKDTAQLNMFSVYGLEKFFSRAERAKMARSMGGVGSMLPKGGSAIWGNEFWVSNLCLRLLTLLLAFDDNGNENTRGPMLHTRDNITHEFVNHTTEQAIDFLEDISDEYFRKMMHTNYSNGIAWTEEEVKKNNADHRKWVNPLETSLPYAPSMKIYCIYGVGKPTERGYYYFKNEEGEYVIDSSVDDGTEIENGVVLGEGDGTLPLLSLGFMCRKGWKLPRYNPANISITTHELLHKPDSFDLRGGPSSSEHVDILGNTELNEYILKIAAGKGHEIENHIVSDIDEILDKITV
ncbi:phospholipid-diacylglycerol acyltransferase Plh1 [Schizosaccharomyces japonicus yFS275]|uniref:Phospholipid-diacylglycerol acyltransferase Plh1 n=1 Tax=Schizosaccharomyces japonicus (strain yFS275 / FY16936) TaxID=402676 RepID=B6K3H8_SCHJY|nr:phospholipid-diacylglycerol acyltransferase Plh1 [Schizosaccharomyces japonicus yFS275]EEB08035.1 phospholipid-diacylglycerol acyltransferase Plh1 [Schizosaccharomyces japonicus yFS275]